MTTYALWALGLGFALLLWRGHAVRTELRRVTSRVDEIDRQAGEIERRYRDDQAKSRESLRREIRSALREREKELGSVPADPLMEQVIETLRTVHDPEIPVNIYDLGLIYEVIVPAPKRVHIKMSLTSPMCPSAREIPAEVERTIRSRLEVEEVRVEVVWDPKWGPHMISEEGKQKLGL